MAADLDRLALACAAGYGPPMVRLPALLLVVLSLAAAAPTPSQRALLMRLPSPASEDAARVAAREWLLNRLANPGKAEITYQPTVRSVFGAVGPTDKPLLGVWMCGTISGLSTLGNRRTARWRVRFDPDRPGEVYFGAIADTPQWRFLPADCDEIYRDGIRVFGP